MSKKELTELEWKQLTNSFLSEIAKSATRNWGGVQKVADKLKMPKQSISGMRSPKAIGNKVSWTRMLFYKAGISDTEAKKILQNPHIVIKEIESPSFVDEIFGKLKNLYSENELVGYLKLLLAKRQIEKDLEVSIRVHNKPPSTSARGRKKKDPKVILGFIAKHQFRQAYPCHSSNW